MKITSAQSGRVYPEETSAHRNEFKGTVAQGAEVSLEISQSIVELHRITSC